MHRQASLLCLVCNDFTTTLLTNYNTSKIQSFKKEMNYLTELARHSLKVCTCMQGGLVRW